MCGRYHLSGSAAAQAAEILADPDLSLELRLMERDIRPGDKAPVILGDRRKDSLYLDWQTWGFPSPHGKGLLINARAETVTEKPSFREGMRHFRAVLFGTYFYEWNRAKEKFTFRQKGSCALFMAGICRLFPDGPHFVILTTPANASMAPVHDRMPLVLEKEEIRDWIFDEKRAGELLHKLPGPLEKSCDYEQQTLFDLL